ncbi:Ig-like domain-containing protein [uncultured Shewanella sp.]|uniref:Ig-like domain-containing protein n=1 Tax=uncultured Shewanella sp. TaxID=173975 RepID=UPI002628A08B|nr:Ig-like domain-containing protein [uncultured Shewanella sp.]
MKNRFSLTLLATAILAGCGGSDSSSDTSEPIVNRAPQAAADSLLVQNNEATSFDVLANDSDNDGDALTITSITSQPESGSVEIVDNQILYTPESNVATTDSFTYEISDGEFTASAEVAVTVNHTLTISGLVTDSPIANALVSIAIGDDLFEVEADSNGNYSLPITINDMSALVLINAKGSADQNQENVELITVAGQTSTLLTKAGEERQLTNEENNLTNVTHVSTANYLLAEDRAESGEITSEQQFNQLASEVSPEELVQTSAFIKLLVDNANFDIPEGETVLSLLDAEVSEGSGVDTSAAIQAYLVANNHVDANGEVTEAYSAALEEAIEQTVTDANVIEQFRVDDIVNKTMLSLYGAKQGWNQHSGRGMNFNADGSGELYKNFGSHDDSDAVDFTWSVVDGKLDVEYQNYSSKVYWMIAYPYDELVTNYGFSQTLVDEVVAAADAGLIPDAVFELESGTARTRTTLIGSTPSSYQAVVTNEEYTKLILPTSVTTWTNPTPRVTSEYYYNQTLIHTPESAFDGKTLADIAGDWVLNLDVTVQSHNLEGFTALMADFVTISGSSATARNAKQQFTASLTDGVLSLTNGNVVYKFTPVKTEGKGHLAQVEKWVDNKLELVLARQIAKFDSSYEQYIEDLVTELPKAQMAYINGSIQQQWDGDKLKLEHLWGYVFNADGTLNRGVAGITPEYDWGDLGNGIGYFHLGDDSWTWNTSGRNVNLYQSSDWAERQRTWEVISVDDQGRALVLEHSVYGWDIDNNGVIEDDEFGQFLYPRINVIKVTDLSDWQAEWQNTIDLGLLSVNAPAAIEQKESVLSVKPLSNKGAVVLK